MKLIFYLLLVCTSFTLGAQDRYSITGSISSNARPLEYANVFLEDSNKGSTTNHKGEFSLHGILPGTYTLTASFVGYKTEKKQIKITDKSIDISFDLLEDNELDEVVVTGTRTPKRKTNSPVIVNLINSKTLEQVAATDLSQGLRFQPGLRVETDCQTCNYTQIRMNGLQGGYSQILINGRPIFSPLTGLYGLEQIPVNMIERIEVVRGGVSALYGSSAIGGTINIITKIPKSNNYSVNYNYESINAKATQNVITGNATVVNDDFNAGANFFVSHRNRTAYDANGDNFSELPELKGNSFGMNGFYLPTANSKLELSLSSLYEYRYGGEIVDQPAFLAQQSEERDHHILMASLDYQINFNNDKSALIVYYGGQKTDRDHYTGIIPDEANDKQAFFANPPYGISEVLTHQGGTQYNHRFNEFLGGSTVLTGGLEFVYDGVYDEIAAYNYLIDQTTRNIGLFLQNDWNVTKNLNVLSGFRLDKHNLVDHTVFSPRVSLLYKLQETTQFRMGWGTGFRAPQAFDTDLHIAFAGGGISRISLDKNLTEERSNSYTASVNYDKATTHFIAGFTLEGFYTRLHDAFYLAPIGTDTFGDRFEKRNGSGATVKGITLEGRANMDYLFEIEAGFTVQSSAFSDAVETIEGLEAKKEFLRTPNHYGYATFSYTPTKTFNTSANLVYTGPMDIAHFAGESTGQESNTYFKTPAFIELSLRSSYTFNLNKINTSLELFGGIKNITNSYQNDFDFGKNRDSNYIYGPGAPRSVFAGLKIKSL